MARWRASKESSQAYRLSHQRMLHEIKIPDEAGEQRAQSEKDGRAIRCQGIAAGHRVSHERIPQAHQYSRDNARNQTFSGELTARAGKISVGFPIEDHRDQRTKHANAEKHRVTFLLQRVTKHSSNNQSDSDGDGEGNG